MEAFLHDLSWVLPLRAEWLTPVMEAASFLGYRWFFLMMLPIGYWLWNKDMFTRLAVLIMLTALLNAFFKDLLQDPRPDLSLALDDKVGDSYGMPSGHAQVATAMWLWLAYELKRVWAWPVAIFIVAAVCFSRLYLGVHDVEDILAGVALGLLSIGIFRVFLSERFRRWHDLRPAGQIAILLAVQPVVWFLWPKTSASGATAAMGLLAFLTGWWIGVLYDRHRMDFKRHPNWMIALAATIVGIALLMAIYTGVARGLLATGIGPIPGVWVQSLIIAAYVTAVAPWLFRRARVGH